MTFRLAGWQFKLTLAFLLVAFLVLVRPNQNGDVVEYSLTTIAIAAHGTPDIRLSDIDRGKQLLPQLAEPYGLLERGMRNNDEQLYAAFTRGRDGKVYSVHFFGYSALAALPFKVLDMVGAPPLKCFQVVNSIAIIILGLALFHFFGSIPRTLFGLGLFMLCGGVLYWTWSSPECLSAAALLSALLLFTSGAPLAGALLAGLAGQQNPTIVFFFCFAPLLLCLERQPGTGLRASLAPMLKRRYLLALAAGMSVFALPPLFNLYQFGVPNIIAKLFSDPKLIGPTRLVSFYFDLNQGMIIAIPGVLAALALWGWRGGQLQLSRQVPIIALCAAFTLALALPALAILNWNSGAAGVMRYAFWAAMPFVFALLWHLRSSDRCHLPLLLGVGLVQAASMVSALSYSYVEFSPLARLLLKHAPTLYHPEPEIFAERMAHNDDYIQPEHVYVYKVDGQQVKTLFNSAQPGIEARLCGTGGVLAPDNRFADSQRNWRYIDGLVRCLSGGVPQTTFQLDHFNGQAGLQLATGWSGPESNGGVWNGVWSEGARSRIVIKLDPDMYPATLSLLGNYLDGNTRTRVIVNGADLGWQQLDRVQRLVLPPTAASAIPLEIKLEYEAPHRLDTGSDTRVMAFFLREITLRYQRR
jgi:hypothetical protein